MHVVTVGGGLVEGVRVGDVLHYRGLPYARARRFGAPEPAPGWAGTRDASRHGPICPQSRSPLAKVIGESPDTPEDEDCLTLSVATPVVDSERPRPVMLWLHGGAYVIGAGSYEWYRPDSIVNEGDVVVVNVNYRLGVFGYARVEGVSPGNLGLLDQVVALRWVAKNIAAFGGDPAQVTVFGESAGAHSIAALLSIPEARGLFRRAIVQSGQLGLGFMSVAHAERAGRMIRRCLGDADPRSATTEQLLTAQQAAIVKFQGPAGLNSAPLFGPIAGVAPLPEPAQPNIARAIVHENVDLLIGTNREEMRAFFDSNPNIVRFKRFSRAGSLIVDAIAAAVTHHVFAEPARKLADVQAKNGAAVYRYLFEWTPPREAFGVCHTIELPFVFGNEAAWRDSPMLAGADWEHIDALGRQMRRAWTRFARYGDPNAAEDPPWPRHTAVAAVGRRFRR